MKRRTLCSAIALLPAAGVVPALAQPARMLRVAWVSYVSAAKALGITLPQSLLVRADVLIG